MESREIKKLEEIMKELSPYEKKGLDTSSLKIFIKNFKEFLKLNNIQLTIEIEPTLEEKQIVIKNFLEDTKAFPTIKDVINFANERLGLDFKDQKESRETTINRIIGRINSRPELKEIFKKAVFSIRNEMVHNTKQKKTKKQIITAETFSKWAEIIKNI